MVVAHIVNLCIVQCVRAVNHMCALAYLSCYPDAVDHRSLLNELVVSGCTSAVDQYLCMITRTIESSAIILATATGADIVRDMLQDLRHQARELEDLQQFEAEINARVPNVGVGDIVMVIGGIIHDVQKIVADLIERYDIDDAEITPEVTVPEPSIDVDDAELTPEPKRRRAS